MPSSGQAGCYFFVTIPRSSGLPRRSRAHDADLRDPSTVHRPDLEPEPLDLDRVADRSEASEAAEHEPADGVVGLVRQLEAEPLAQRVERRESIYDKCPGRLLFEGRRLPVELVLNLTDQLLDHVLQRHQAGGAPEFIQNDRELYALPPELRKRLRSEEHTSELQSQFHLVCRLLLEKKKQE